MVYKLIIKIHILAILCLLPINSYSNIVYDKNNIVISNIDLDYYTQLYFENFGEKINKSNAIKNIVLIKNVINNFKKNNPDFLNRVDDVLVKEYGSKKMDIQIVKDFVRYFKIKNEFIYEYYFSKFNIRDLENVFNTYEKIEDSNCQKAIDWWPSQRVAWEGITLAWEEHRTEHDTMSFMQKKGGIPLWIRLFWVAKRDKDASSSDESKERAYEKISDYLVEE